MLKFSGPISLNSCPNTRDKQSALPQTAPTLAAERGINAARQFV